MDRGVRNLCQCQISCGFSLRAPCSLGLRLSGSFCDEGSEATERRKAGTGGQKLKEFASRARPLQFSFANLELLLCHLLRFPPRMMLNCIRIPARAQPLLLVLNCGWSIRSTRQP